MAAWPHGRKINLLFILQSKSSFAGFLVERRQIMPSTLHYLHHMIEGDTMVAVGSDGAHREWPEECHNCHRWVQSRSYLHRHSLR